MASENKHDRSELDRMSLSPRATSQTAQSCQAVHTLSHSVCSFVRYNQQPYILPYKARQHNYEPGRNRWCSLLQQKEHAVSAAPFVTLGFAVISAGLRCFHGADWPMKLVAQASLGNSATAYEQWL